MWLTRCDGFGQESDGWKDSRLLDRTLRLASFGRTRYWLAGFIAVIALAACGGGEPAPPSALATPIASQPVGGDATALEDQFISVISRVSQSVVVIETASGLGSGVIVDTQGDIVTNAHVVGESSAFRVYLATGKSYEGTLVGAFVPDDLAVIRITAPDLHPAVFGDSDRLRVGSIVMAVGSPLGLQSSVTEGIVSALGRQVTEPNGIALPPLIQTSADINPGNSGGALVDLNGEVIGIPTLAAQDPQAGGTAPGIGFAIPSNVAKDIAAQLIKNGRVTNSHRAYLGVQGASLPNGSGVSIYTVVSGGPADKAGLKAGDVITAIGGRRTPDQPNMASVLSGLQPGQSLQIQITRPDGSVASVTVTLGELPG
jgi:putative serine protease PepD